MHLQPTHDLDAHFARMAQDKKGAGHFCSQTHMSHSRTHSEEILNVNTIESASPSWTRSVLSHDQVIQWTKAKVRVYSDSVLWLGKMSESKDAILRLEGQVEEFKMYPSNKELPGINGEAIEFEWNIFPGFLSLQILQEIQQDLKRKSIEPEESVHRPDHLHVNVQRHRLEKGNDEICISNAEKVKDYAMRFLQGHWTFLGPGSEKNLCGRWQYPTWLQGWYVITIKKNENLMGHIIGIL